MTTNYITLKTYYFFQTTFLYVPIVQMYSFPVPKATIWFFRCRAMSETVGNEHIERSNPENMRMLFGIFYLCDPWREFQQLPVRHPPFCVSDVGKCRRWLHQDGRPWKHGVTIWNFEYISSIGRQLEVFPVWRPPSCVSGVGRRRRVSVTSPLDRATPKT